MPIDHNIVFAPNKMNVQNRQLGQQDRMLDLRERQLDGEGEGLGKIVERATIKASSGQPLDQNEMAAIDAWSALKGGQTYTDPVTQQVMTRPTLRDNLQKMGKLGDFMPPTGINPAEQENLNRNWNGNLGILMGGPKQMDPSQLPDLGNFPKMPSGQLDQNIINAPNMDMLRQRAMGQSPKVTGPLAGTPRANLMEAEADLKNQSELSKQTAKNEASALNSIGNTGVTLDAFNQLLESSKNAPSGMIQDLTATGANKFPELGFGQELAANQGDFSVNKANVENMIRQTFRVAGSGATSDRDALPFIKMLPDETDSAPVKKAKINAAMSALRRRANTLASQRGLESPFPEQAETPPAPSPSAASQFKFLGTE
jgi:hypothetical protein